MPAAPAAKATSGQDLSGSNNQPPRTGWPWAVRYRQAISQFTVGRPFATLFGAGALSALAMAPFHFWPVLLFTLPTLFWALEDVSDAAHNTTLIGRLRAAAWRGWAFGFGYHFAGLYWIGHSFLVQAERFAVLMPFAILALTASLGLFFAIAASAHASVNHRLIGLVPRLFLLALVIMSAEWLRGHILTGFPWNILGYALTMPLPLMQSAAHVGIYGLTAITVITLTVPMVVASGPAQHPIRIILALTIAPLALAFLYGSWQLAQHPTEYVSDINLRLVQPGFSQRDKFDPAKYGQIFRRQLEMSYQAPQSSPASTPSGAPPNQPVTPTHVLWPEAAIPFLIRRERSALTAIANALPDDIQIIAGGFRINVSPDVPQTEIRQYRLFNSALVIGSDGQVKSFYDKIHLVPFGEYLPAQGLLEALGFENLTRTRGGLAMGKAPRQLMRIMGLPPAAMLICYEASFPGELIQGSERPGVLINLTNDAWFGTSSGPFQHLHQTRLRAVEQGLPMLRSANTGISAIVDPMGRIVHRLGLNEIGVIDGRLPRPRSPGFYAQNKGFLELAIFLFLTLIALTGARHRLWQH